MEEEIAEATSIFGKQVQSVTDNANKHELLKKPTTEGTLEQDPAARQSYLLGALIAIVREIRALQSVIIYEG